jgi:hypothetical protein
MKFDADDILQRVAQTENELGDWYILAREWDKMWALDPGFNQSWRDSVEQDGREQVITPVPYNVVNLAQRLIANSPNITVPPRSQVADDGDLAQRIERWLQGAWQRADVQQGYSILAHLSWQMLVRGVACMEVKWIKDDLPDSLADDSLPFLIRYLEPMNVGVKRGPHYTEWAYHKYETDWISAKQSYPELKKHYKDRDGVRHERTIVRIVDYWHTDPKTGRIWNAILADNEFVKPLTETDYPRVPIIEGYGDSAPSTNPVYRRLSLLHAINGAWQYQCRLRSNLATGVLWSTWPHFSVQNQNGAALPANLTIRPGATDVLPYGTQITQTVPQFNIGALQAILDQIEGDIQQATFPKVMFGDSGAMQAGFGVQMLTASAAGRTTMARESLERMIQQANELMLALVEEFGDSKGVELYAYDRPTSAPYIETLKPKEIAGYYRNIVNLRPNIPQDEIGNTTMLVRLADSGYLSHKTLRDNIRLIQVPPDEETRIAVERVKQNPALQPRFDVAHAKEAYPDDWQTIITGTDLEQPARDMGLWEEPEPEPQPEPGRMPNPGMMGPGGPMGPDMGMMGMGGPMPPQGPPQGPMGPDMGMGGPPPIQPPMEMIPPSGGGIPPTMQGLFESEDLGLNPQTDELLFQQAMGNPMQPAEELALLAQRGGVLPPGQ